MCAHEGSVPCLFCTSLVDTREEQLELDKKKKKVKTFSTRSLLETLSQYLAALD